MSFPVVDGLSKSYGDVHALIDMNLAVDRGEFISLLGPSGCGKTTTLLALAGFVQATRGASSSTGATSPRCRPTSAAWASNSRVMRCSRT